MPILAKSHREGSSGKPRRSWSPAWWWGFGLSLFLPAATLAFLLSGPHEIIPALLWTLPTWLLIAADRFGPTEVRQVPASAPRGFFDGLLYALVILQLANVLALGGMVAQLTWNGWGEFWVSVANLAAVRTLVGPDFCCAAIAPAHELIHRRDRRQRRLGRLLLMSVGYDHFYVAHRAGHHPRLGSADDPSTALAGESYGDFVRRSVAAQWRLAWRTEPRSVGRGLLLELACFAGYGLVFGPLALVVLAWQCVVAVRQLEVVNYFQHFGLTLESGHAGATAWHTDSAVSLFLFLGLTRHADHHRRPAVPYPDLRAYDDQPRLAFGYMGMAVWVKNRGEDYRRWAAETLAGRLPEPEAAAPRTVAARYAHPFKR
jgi:alkane 1-monooxygenase